MNTRRRIIRLERRFPPVTEQATASTMEAASIILSDLTLFDAARRAVTLCELGREWSEPEMTELMACAATVNAGVEAGLQAKQAEQRRERDRWG